MQLFSDKSYNLPHVGARMRIPMHIPCSNSREDARQSHNNEEGSLRNFLAVKFECSMRDDTEGKERPLAGADIKKHPRDKLI